MEKRLGFDRCKTSPYLESIIVTDDFDGHNLVQRHRKVYEAMGELMNHEIHALSMKTYTQAEWEEKQ